MPGLITITGNLAADPDLRATPSGLMVANFTVADTPRVLNKQTNEWSDGETVWWRCSIWREAAENVAESLRKGQRVIVTGTPKQRNWEKDGVKHSSIELDAQEVGPSLKYATATVTKRAKEGGGGGGGNYGGGGGGYGGGGFAGSDDEPPF